MTRLFILPAIFVISTISLWYMITSAPGWNDNGELNGITQKKTITKFELPTQFDNFTVMAERFRNYKEDHYIYISTLFICTYLYKQTFAIPGSFLLNIIAGAVFGMWSGFLMVCFLTTCGSTLCYLFSELFSREYVLYYFGEKLTYLQQKVDDNSHRLLPFLLFARMFPISPSWLLNIVAPFLNIPLPIFAISAFVGLAPYNFICVQAGYILADLKSWDDVFTKSTMLKLCSFALLPLAYAMFVKRHPKQSEFETKNSFIRQTFCCCLRRKRRSRKIISIVTQKDIDYIKNVDENKCIYESEFCNNECELPVKKIPKEFII